MVHLFRKLTLDFTPGDALPSIQHYDNGMSYADWMFAFPLNLSRPSYFLDEMETTLLF